MAKANQEQASEGWRTWCALLSGHPDCVM